MKKTLAMDSMVTRTVGLSAELNTGLQAMARLKNLSEESLIRLWIEEALEREELRFERLLLFAELTSDLDEATLQAIARLRQRHFDEQHDGERGLDPYMVKSRNLNHLYTGRSGTLPVGNTMK